MTNTVILRGRLVADPETRFTQSGVQTTQFTLAVRRRFKNAQTGEYESDFIRCITWRKTAELAANYLRKGLRVGVVGSWQTSNFEGQDGKRIYNNDCLVEELDLIDFADNGNNGQNQGGNTQPNTNYQPPQQNGTPGQYGGNNQQYNQQNNVQNAHYGQQQNYNRIDDDPFANSKGPIEVSEDDLPF